jgi:hypothetical protein
MPANSWSFARQNSQAIRRSRIASIDGLVHSDFDTASPFTLKFDEADRGKRVYFCLRWESSTNLKGPWGEIGAAIIP